ncbi:MAG: cyclic nucleotide-binding domain-containing protein [Candidatus Neomarinimicrobiota bacterium]
MFLKMIKIKAGEGEKVLTFFFFNFFIVAFSITAKTARDVYFLTSFDRSFLPLMFLASAVGVGLVIAAYTRIPNNISWRNLFIFTGSLFMGSMVLSQFFIKGWFIPIIYVWVDIVVVIMIIQFWDYISRSFDSRQAKRLLGIIGGGASFAAMVVGIGLKPFVHFTGTYWLLILAAVFIFISMIFGLQILSSMKPLEIQPLRKKSKAGLKPRLDPFLIGIAVVIALSAVVTTIVDYQFKMIASETFPDAGKLVEFFGLFYAVVGFVSLIIQFFVTGAVLSRFGVLIGLLILPVMLIFGSVTILITPLLFSVVLAKFSDQTFKFTINSSTLELLWLPVPLEKRKKIKPIISGTLKGFAEGFAGLITFIIVKFIALQYLSILTLGAIGIWLMMTFRLKKGYVTALMSAIENRELNFEELSVDVQDAAMVSTIQSTLDSEDEIKQLFALDLINGLPLNPWKSSLTRLFKTGSLNVRKQILALAWDDTNILSDQSILDAISEDNGVSNAAIQIAGQRKIKSIVPTLENFLSHADLERRAASAAAILNLQGDSKNNAQNILTAMLDSVNEKDQVIALKNLSHNRDFLSLEKLIDFLKTKSSLISNAALSIAKAREDESCLPAVITNLDSHQTAPSARGVLKIFPNSLVIENLQKSFEQEDLPRKLKLGLIRTLKDYPDIISLKLLLNQLDRNDFPLYSECIESILALAKENELPPEILEELAAETWELAHQMFDLNEILNLLPKGQDALFLQDFYEIEIKHRIPTLIKLGILDVPDTPVDGYIDTILSGDVLGLPLVLEFFENIFSKQERDIINPIIEPMTIKERSAIGRKVFKNLHKNFDGVLTLAALSPNKWESVIALDYIFNHHKFNILEKLNWNKIQDSSANRELISRQINKNGSNLKFIPQKRFKFQTELFSMYSTLEKTIILKSISLFRNIPTEDLSHVAQITEEVQMEAETPIFKEGDRGDSLFIVVDGSVRIHKGSRDLAEIGKGSFLGEMALLDKEPRSADATVLEKTTLFKISQGGFYEAMRSNMEIMQGIIKLLTGRLRKANEKLIA